MMDDDVSRRQEEKLVCLLGTPGQIAEVLLAIGFGSRSKAAEEAVQAPGTTVGDAVARGEAQRPIQIPDTTVKVGVSMDQGIAKGDAVAGSDDKDPTLSPAALVRDAGVSSFGPGTGVDKVGDGALSSGSSASSKQMAKERRKLRRREATSSTDRGSSSSGSDSRCEPEDMETGVDERAHGVVSKFFGEKGFGFITADGYDDDIFFHINDAGGQAFAKGDRVSFGLRCALGGKYKAVRIARTGDDDAVLLAAVESVDRAAKYCRQGGRCHGTRWAIARPGRQAATWRRLQGVSAGT